MTYPKSSDNEAVRHFFTGTVADYSKLFLPKRSGNNFGFRERLTLASQLTADISGRLLDCACGTGEITTAILKSGRFSSATVVDLSSRMLEAAQQRIEPEFKELKGQLEFISSDIFEFATQFHSERYDLILCLGLIAHTGRLDELLASLKTILSPKGSILLQSSLLDHAGTRIVRALTRERYYRKHGYCISYFRHEDIVQAVQESGLIVVECRRFTFGFPFGDHLCARVNYHVENALRNWSRLHGAEALYMLRQNPN